MAKITITLTDAENENVDAHVEFDPRIENISNENADDLTPAQATALAMLSMAFPPEEAEWQSRTVDKQEEQG